MIDILSSSVGIIGGADGPTVIFVTGSPGAWLIPALILAAAAVIAVLVVVKKKKTK